MASVRCRKDTGLLLLDFRYQGARCREQTLLPDTQENRSRLQKLAGRVEKALNNGTFSYQEFFPGSPRAKGGESVGSASSVPSADGRAGDATLSTSLPTPTFAEFAELWFVESGPRWRKRYQDSMRWTLDRFLIPEFGHKQLAEISRADVLAFRAVIAKRPGRAGQRIGGDRVNKLMTLLNAILIEGCDRFRISNPGRGIKPLKKKRPEVQPFTLEEVETILATVRQDYRPYLVVRMLTGLRTGEVNGLQWNDVDFANDSLRVERTISRDGDGETKTEESRRSIPLVPHVREALQEQKLRAAAGCPWIFHSARANPIDAVNFTNRVWYPLLRHLGLKLRRPYQMRHTAATLMLASGENPEWVARILGHSTTEMLFRVYSRFVPNVTRSDGRAFKGLVQSRLPNCGSQPPSAPSAGPDLTSLPPEQLRALLSDALQRLDTIEKGIAP